MTWSLEGTSSSKWDQHPSNFEVGSSRYPQFSPCSICAVCCKGGVSGTSDNEAIFHTSSILPTSFGPHLILPVSGRSTMVLTGFFLLSIRKYYPILSKGSLMECEVSNFRNRVRTFFDSPYGLFGLGRWVLYFSLLCWVVGEEDDA